MIYKLMNSRKMSAKAQIGFTDTAPSLTHPISQACTQAQMNEVAYAYWCSRIAEAPRSHRKQWEFCYILQALARNGMIAPGLKGLGFGVGGEPLSALLAVSGVEILATDLTADEAQAKGWVDTDQHARDRDALNSRGICPPDVFEKMVKFRSVDMNAVPDDMSGFDFCWSACALEHLGSIKLGLSFIERSLSCLKPGGIAVHTTELNCNSDTATLDNDSTVLFRKRDFMILADRMRAAGHYISLNFNIGTGPLDQYVDVPPYGEYNHLKLKIQEWVTTSYGLIIKKAG
jgi:2-polyprenyl-3-methyl-5-hydroxy-6-metoxy-1,4-benzoquinol methylase